MPTAPCAIWNTPAEQLEKAGDYEILDSPRAGGQYWISGCAIAEMPTLNDRAKLLLTTWLCEQRRAGVPIPRIHQNIFDFLKSRRPLSVAKRITNALMVLGHDISELGTQAGFGESEPKTPRYLAETESGSVAELGELFQMLRKVGYVEGSFSLGGGGCPPSALVRQNWQIEEGRVSGSS